jgi:hypothetical protein
MIWKLARGEGGQTFGGQERGGRIILRFVLGKWVVRELSGDRALLISVLNLLIVV